MRHRASRTDPQATWQLRDLPAFPGAACAGVDEPWHLERGSPADPAVRRMAAVCASCPALQACRSYALARPVDGFWGGMTMPQRREWRAARGLPSGRAWSSWTDALW